MKSWRTLLFLTLPILLCTAHLQAQDEPDDDSPVSAPTPGEAQRTAEAAYALACRGDANGAIAGYSRAISLDPKLAWAYTGRGLVKYHSKYDTRGAIADFDQAIALDPYLPQTFFARGDAQLSTGNVDDAIADFSSVIHLRENWGATYCWRAYAEHEKALEQPDDASDFDQKALDDLNKGIELDPKDEGYAQVYIWIIRTQDPGLVDDATRNLARYMNTRSDIDNWEYQIGEFLSDRMSEHDLLDSVQHDKGGSLIVRRCEGFFYIGMKHVANGDIAGATTLLKQALATGVRHGSEADLAQVWLDHPPAAKPGLSFPH